jgi:hypothetical protein
MPSHKPSAPCFWSATHIQMGVVMVGVVVTVKMVVPM